MGGSERDAAAASAARFVGRPMPRAEDVRFLTGRARYVGDFQRDGMCHAAVVRSPLAHARLTGIGGEAALALPGVLAVLAFADLGDLGGPIPIRLAPLPGFDRYRQAPVARDRVRYVGEPVAVVIAEDRYVAEDAVERVTVEYEPLDPVVDVSRALADRPVLHEDPLGAKGAGEGGIVATGAAAANAVAAALAPLGVVVRELPLSPGAIGSLLREARGDR